MKLSFEDKKSIYNLHLQGYGYRTIAAIFEVDDTSQHCNCRLFCIAILLRRHPELSRASFEHVVVDTVKVVSDIIFQNISFRR